MGLYTTVKDDHVLLMLLRSEHFLLFFCCNASRADADYGAAKVMLRPACPGSGVIAGGAVRVVLEMAGVENALGKQLRSKNPLNNARATIKATQMMKQFKDVAEERGIPMEELWK
jgi:small subunit ribosomal protein S5